MNNTDDDFVKLRKITQITSSLIKYIPLDIINRIIIYAFEETKKQHVPLDTWPLYEDGKKYAVVAIYKNKQMFSTQQYINILGVFDHCFESHNYAASFLKKNPTRNYDIHIIHTNCFLNLFIK